MDSLRSLFWLGGGDLEADMSKSINSKHLLSTWLAENAPGTF